MSPVKQQPRAMATGAPVSARAVAGFSLFELVVFIISVAIIYAYAANRFADFPGQAERANFLAVSTQLQNALNLELNYGLHARGLATPQQLAGANPMDFMLEPPRNYLGAFDAVDVSRLQRRSWYFDRSREQLVYLVNDDRGVALLVDGRPVPGNEIRFHIVADYGLMDPRTGLPRQVLESREIAYNEANLERKFRGMVMRPVIPYRWQRTDEDTMLSAALTN